MGAGILRRKPLEKYFRELIEEPVVEKPSTSISIKTSPRYEFVGHQGWVRSFVFLQDNVHIVSGSDDRTMRKWNCETGMLVGEPWKVDSQVIAMALSPDGKTIACGRGDGCVQQWDTNGQMQDIWTGHSGSVWALTWSPSGRQLASGSDDRTILIRKSESGKVEVGPIKMNHDWVCSVAYSPSGDRIASAGGNSICIWDTNTGDLLVGPIEGWAYSVVWSLDGSKLYSAGKFTRVLDSTSGTELHRFHLDKRLDSIALSPKQNLFAGVGKHGIAQLWDMQPLGQPFHHENHLLCVSFSPNGQYLAYSGTDNKVTLSIVKDSAPELPAATAEGFPSKSMLQPPLSDVDATNPFAKSAVDDDDGRKDLYKDFFTSSHSSLSLPSHNYSLMRHFKHTFSFLHLPEHQSMRLHVPRFSSCRALSNTPSHVPVHSGEAKPLPKGKLRAGAHDELCNDVSHPENVVPETTKLRNDKGKPQEEPIPHERRSAPRHHSSTAELESDTNRELWKLLSVRRQKGSNKASAEVAQDTSPEVVEVYAARGVKRLVPHKQKHRAILLDQKPSVSTAPSGVGPSSQGHAGPSSQFMPIAGSVGSSRPTRTEYTDNDSCSDLSIQGPCLKFLEKICYPCGRYHEEDT